MTKTKSTIVFVCLMFGFGTSNHHLAAQGQAGQDTAALDKILAPVALYPDALVAQILICSTNPTKVRELQTWMQKNKNLKGTALQEAAGKQFDPSFVAIS